MTAVVIILILLGLLLLTPLGAKVKYSADETRLAVYWGFIKINILPKKEKKKKPEKEKKEKKKKEPKKPSEDVKEDKKEKKKKKKRPLSFWLGLAKAGLSSAGIFLRGIAVDKLHAVITVADSDPAKTAINYGRACAVVGSFSEYTDKLRRIKDCDVQVNADFYEDKMKFDVDAEVSFLLYSVFGMAFNFAFQFIKLLIKEKKAGK